MLFGLMPKPIFHCNMPPSPILSICGLVSICLFLFVCLSAQQIDFFFFSMVKHSPHTLWVLMAGKGCFSLQTLKSQTLVFWVSHAEVNGLGMWFYQSSMLTLHFNYVYVSQRRREHLSQKWQRKHLVFRVLSYVGAVCASDIQQWQHRWSQCAVFQHQSSLFSYYFLSLVLPPFWWLIKSSRFIFYCLQLGTQANSVWIISWQALNFSDQ